ncbi:MAG: T9SS type A sorting domain-containing protein, partial [Bacteroidia bacterium]|nr:T9SS type A sorting domain-containing protein [Bacteroidia bacterium]
YSVLTYSQYGDTVTVQTFTFGSPQDAWFVFPPDTVSFEKILMQYTLKCNPAQNPACGEWDYLTYTYLYHHTGLIDSSIIHQPLFLVNGNVIDTFNYITSPAYAYIPEWQYYIVHDDTLSLNTYMYGTGSQLSSRPFGSSLAVSRTQYLWKASELAASGMGSGTITGLQFDLQTTGGMLKNLAIRIKATSLDSLSESTFSATGFTEVYRKNTFFAVNGWNSLQLLTPFTWNGTSNIIIDINYENSGSGEDNIVNATDAGYNAGLFKAGDDRCIGVHNGGYVNVPINDSLKKIDSLITVSFWGYGDPQYQPQDGTSFEGVDSAGNRVINAHVPWSDSKIYWDAGNAGNLYDRISKTSTATNIKGKWSYWAFTKNVATGTMKIYLNGNLWCTGTGKTRAMGKIKKFYIGKGTWSGSQSYEGRMDEFTVFNAELNQATIQENMHNGINASNPYYNNLVLYYKFDDGDFQFASDSAPCANPDAILTCIDNPLKNPDDYIYGFTQTSLRPNVIFEQGDYSSHIDSVFVLDSAMNYPVQVITYTDSINNPGVPVDTFSVWQAAYYNYAYDSLGNIVDSIYVNPDGTMFLTYYDYYQKFPQVIRYELARYITPYGNGLSLGNGWTWTFDVTDYRPLLTDSVHLSAGNWQELLDMRFLMIKGIPPRDVVSIQNLWNGGFNYGQSSDPIESHLTPIQVYIPSNAYTARWKSRVTGHGMDTPQNCAEFCAKYHYYKINGVQQFSKLVWRDNCDLNPLYPQGGTWVYDRSNWCPGAEVWTYDFEITPFITPGDSITLDHNVQSYTSTGGWDYYQIEDQLVTYSAPNFTLDAAIENVLSPTTDQMWGRLNPICTKPKIIIKNKGSANLTSLTITYGITGAAPSVYNWTGNLKFMEQATLQLGTFTWLPDATTFTVSISNPNGGIDEYLYNNTRITQFNYVQEMPSQFVIECKSNNYPSENDYTVKDDNDNIILSVSGMSANTYYRDTLDLPAGCYVFRLTDSGEDGLTWWANTAQGSGTIKFKNVNNTTLKNFNSDFGGEVYMQFTVDLSTGSGVYIFTNSPELKVYPNPAGSMVYIDIDMPSSETGIVEIADIYGKNIKSYSFSKKTAESFETGLSALQPGVYFVKLRTQNYSLTKKMIHY